MRRLSRRGRGYGSVGGEADGEEDADGVQLEVAGASSSGFATAPAPDLNGAQGEEGEVEDERRREERVLARVVHHDRLLATHENVRRVPGKG